MNIKATLNFGQFSLVNFIELLVLLVVGYFFFFYQLSCLTIADWDEARVAKSSLEMLQNKNYINVTYNNEPDFWSTKPPLVHILQIISISFFGFSETASRLPSALMGFFLICFIYYSFKKMFKSYSYGIIAILFLLSSPSMTLCDHSFRTADYDATLTCLMFISIISFYRFISRDVFSSKKLHQFFLFFLLALFSKGTSALFILPGIFIYLLIKKKFIFFFYNKLTALWISGLLGAITTYFLIREHYAPGFITAYNNMEFLGRFMNPSHEFDTGQPKTYYLSLILFVQLPVIWALIPLSLIVLLFKNRPVQDFLLLLLLILFVFLLIISSSSSQNYWYDLPLIPIIVSICAITLIQIVNILLAKFHSTNFVVVYAVALTLAFVPFKYSVSQILSPDIQKLESYRAYYHVSDYLKQGRPYNNSVLLYDAGNAAKQSERFYVDQLKLTGKSIFIESGGVPLNKIVFTQSSKIQYNIESNYRYQELDSYWESKCIMCTQKTINVSYSKLKFSKNGVL